MQMLGRCPRGLDSVGLRIRNSNKLSEDSMFPVLGNHMLRVNPFMGSKIKRKL